MEESISGFKIHGAWDDVVEHGERITQALRQEDIEDAAASIREAFEEWDEWRPKPTSGSARMSTRTRQSRLAAPGAKEKKLDRPPAPM